MIALYTYACWYLASRAWFALEFISNLHNIQAHKDPYMYGPILFVAVAALLPIFGEIGYAAGMYYKRKLT